MKQQYVPSQERIPVLDKGYVRYVDSMGSDLSVVNAARVSYDKESGDLSDGDERLLDYLWKHGHTSPFRHVAMTLEVYAPLMIARQWWKHVVGSDHTMDAWNESSRRYVTEPVEFYTPSDWLEAPENSKQGSGGVIHGGITTQLTGELVALQELGEAWYTRAMEAGVTPEQARLFLPSYGMYVRWRWTASLQSLIHFIELRQGEGAQSEISQYANAVATYVTQCWPASTKALR